MTVAILGGGAAGVFAAIQAPKAILFERTSHLLSKVRISGGGRCNVTHACFDPRLFVQRYPRGSKELLGPITRFGPRQMVDWLSGQGVALKTEEDGRIFPTTDSSETIIEALLHACQATLHTGAKLDVALEQGRFRVGGHLFDRLLLATGSHPSGYNLARLFGHTVIDPVPSLFTFNIPTSPLLDLAGIAVKAKIGLLGKTEEGPLLLTHWGFSGPAILRLSAYLAREFHAAAYQTSLTICWTDQFLAHAEKGRREAPRKAIGNDPLLPERLWRRLLQIASLPPERPWGQLKREEIDRFDALLKSHLFAIQGKTMYKEEFVTAGGVKLSEIDFRTMESRLVPGLYFAGEILDIDGITGGFNLQAAWTTGYIAGLALNT